MKKPARQRKQQGVIYYCWANLKVTIDCLSPALNRKFRLGMKSA